MPSWSEHSRRILDTLHPDLKVVCNEVIIHFDVRLISGWRGKEEQERLFREGKTTLHFPESKHNHTAEDGSPLSLAVDMAPWPIDWEDHDRFLVMGGYVVATARQLGLLLRWGGDWDMDWDLRDQRFVDLPHFELLR